MSSKAKRKAEAIDSIFTKKEMESIKGITEDLSNTVDHASSLKSISDLMTDVMDNLNPFRPAIELITSTITGELSESMMTLADKIQDVVETDGFQNIIDTVVGAMNKAIQLIVKAMPYVEWFINFAYDKMKDFFDLLKKIMSWIGEIFGVIEENEEGLHVVEISDGGGYQIPPPPDPDTTYIDPPYNIGGGGGGGTAVSNINTTSRDIS